MSACNHNNQPDFGRADTPEIWKDIEGYEGWYQVSSLGRVKSLARTVESPAYRTKGFRHIESRLLKHCINRFGYCMVCLCKECKQSSRTIHRLVANAFIANSENKRTINHKNGIKTDNRVENLEWTTHSENEKHSYSELGRKRAWSGLYGINHNSSKPVMQYTKHGEFVAEYAGMAEAHRETGIIAVSIHKCCHAKMKTAGGFVWKFK